jgi:RNA polymerase sigma factor (sigma-70 family)
LRRAAETKNLILRSNLRLVVSIARKHLRAGLSLMELVSGGTMTLMRAIESFDTHRGNKFSTYATLALMKGFARSVPEMMAGRRGTGNAGVQVFAEIADSRDSVGRERSLDREEVDQLLTCLNDRERHVVGAFAEHHQLGRRHVERRFVAAMLLAHRQRGRAALAKAGLQCAVHGGRHAPALGKGQHVGRNSSVHDNLRPACKEKQKSRFCTRPGWGRIVRQDNAREEQ